MRIRRDDNYRDMVYDLLCTMPVSTVLELLTNYHGMQLFDEGFVDFLDSEGIIALIGDDDEEVDNED